MRFVALMSGCAVAMLAFAGSASASTLAVNSAGVLRLDAQFGEVNGVTLREEGTFGPYVVDDSAGLTAGSGCAEVSPTRAQCPVIDPSGAALINKVVLDLGNRDDTSDVFGLTGLTSVEVDGGWGDDVLSGSSVSGYAAYGGSGDDKIKKLDTNSGPIDVDGGSGDDSISTTGTVGAGSIRGGFGADRLTLEGRFTFATVDGGPGRDVIKGASTSTIFPTVFGGFGRDRINLPGASSIDCGAGWDSYGVYEGQTATRCELPLPPPSV